MKVISMPFQAYFSYDQKYGTQPKQDWKYKVCKNNTADRNNKNINLKQKANMLVRPYFSESIVSL